MVPLDVVIMAAGKGTRMKSKVPKVLQTLGAEPLLGHVIQTAVALGARKIVIITGHEAALVKDGAQQYFEQALSQISAQSAASHGLQSNLSAPVLAFALQMPQLGTGHAVQQALPMLADDGVTLVLSGDVPLTQLKTLQSLLGAGGATDLALLTLNTPAPFGYGRILRDDASRVLGIIEEKDANDSQKRITEVYTGMLCAPTKHLKSWVNGLDNKNAQKEYYLTDIVKMAVQSGVPIQTLCITDALEVMGVNSPAQLAELERALQSRTAGKLLEQGVRLRDPNRIDVRGHLHCQEDVEIDINCVFIGDVRLGAGVQVGPNCVIKNAVIEAGTRIQAFTHIEGESAQVPVVIGTQSQIGPFARLRPGASLGPEVHIGNFVEIKNATLARQAKANHLAYVGDADLGERVNFGAGAITANYDGANKHKTVIEADVHIGSNSVLVAPVIVGQGGTVGAGSTITKNTDPGVLTLTRAKQLSLQSWARPKKK